MSFIWHVRGVSNTNFPNKISTKKTNNKVISPKPVSVLKIFVFGNQAMYPSGCMKKENDAIKFIIGHSFVILESLQIIVGIRLLNRLKQLATCRRSGGEESSILALHKNK